MTQSGAVKEVRGRSKSQTMTGIALFAALALALNLAHIQVPAPYLTFLIYEIWEIPIVVCLLIFGLYAALTASVINTFVLIFANPGTLPSGPLYNLIAASVTLGAIVIGHKLSSRARFAIAVEVCLATGLAILVRTSIMTVVNYSLLPLSPPLGLSTPDSAIVPLLPAIAFFNATLALYTVPLGYSGVKAVSRRIHFKTAYPLPTSSAKN